MNIYDQSEKGCNKECRHGMKCLNKLTIKDIGDLRNQFWGTRLDPAPLPLQRRLSITSIFDLMERGVDVRYNKYLNFKLI